MKVHVKLIQFMVFSILTDTTQGVLVVVVITALMGNV